MVFKCLSDDAPDYLKDLIKIDNSGRGGLRSDAKGTKLKVPRTARKTFAARAFSVAGPTWWNGMSLSVKNYTSVESFKRHLKTLLFDKF